MMLPSSEALAKWLAIVRIYTGIFWLIHGIPKWTSGSAQFMGFMPSSIGKMTAESTGPYHTFLATVVAPNAVLFSNLIRAGEVLVGIALVLGILTRFGGAGGMFLALNYILAKGALTAPDTYAGLDAAAFVLSLICLVLPSSAWALDGVTRRGRRRRT
ncbi:MAG: DoxX family membrane protein [Candidatus Eremiobacteraeota bacterium]|nr:DoxX family membrane protein [Candidatus Eremiobacteraeota bacterium]